MFKQLLESTQVTYHHVFNIDCYAYCINKDASNPPILDKEILANVTPETIIDAQGVNLMVLSRADPGLKSKLITKLHVKFGKVTGAFDIRGGNLTTLEGFPKFIGGDFDCSRNALTSLEHGPETVNRIYRCSENKITSLVGLPSALTHLEISSNKLTSLVGIHKIIKSCKWIGLSENPIKEGGLGLLLIKDLEHIGSALPAFQIINKYIGKGKRGMIDCQTELIKAGYKEFAKI